MGKCFAEEGIVSKFITKFFRLNLKYLINKCYSRKSAMTATAIATLVLLAVTFQNCGGANLGKGPGGNGLTQTSDPSLLPQSVSSGCTLVSAVEFGNGKAPGATKPPGCQGCAFKPGFEYTVSLYNSSTGTQRAMLQMDYGYGVYDLSNLSHPRAISFISMVDQIPPAGDGQSYVVSMGVAPD